MLFMPNLKFHSSGHCEWEISTCGILISEGMRNVPDKGTESNSKVSDFFHFVHLLSEITCCLQGPEGNTIYDQHSNVVENSSYTTDVL